jgi:hypothetical protein
MGGKLFITPRADGFILTGSVYNADRQEIVDSLTPEMLDQYSASAAEMGLATDPGGLGTESLPDTLAGELERIRFVLQRLAGKTKWYQPPDAADYGKALVATSASSFGLVGPLIGLTNRIINGDMRVAQYSASAPGASFVSIFYQTIDH